LLTDFRRQLPLPLPNDKPEYVNGSVQDLVKHSSSLDCLSDHVAASSSSIDPANAITGICRRLPSHSLRR